MREHEHGKIQEDRRGLAIIMGLLIGIVVGSIALSGAAEAGGRAVAGGVEITAP